MEHSIRIYCCADEAPTLRELLGWLHDEEVEARLDRDTLNGEKDGYWESADILLPEAEAAVQLDCLTASGDNALEYQELMEQQDNWMEDLEDIGEINPVREHLSTTNFVIQLRLSEEPGDEADDALEILIQNLASQYEGIIHRDGEFCGPEGEPLLADEDEDDEGSGEADYDYDE